MTYKPEQSHAQGVLGCYVPCCRQVGVLPQPVGALSRPATPRAAAAQALCQVAQAGIRACEELCHPAALCVLRGPQVCTYVIGAQQRHALAVQPPPCMHSSHLQPRMTCRYCMRHEGF